MTHKRLHAYQVMQRVARVKEIRASMVLAEATIAENQQRVLHDGLVEARDAIATAGRGNRVSQGDLDMGRYELLAQLGEVLNEKLAEAKSALSAAEQLSRERAAATVTATRHRENIDEHIVDASRMLEQERFAIAREDAIELWLKGKSR